VTCLPDTNPTRARKQRDGCSVCFRGHFDGSARLNLSLGHSHEVVRQAVLMYLRLFFPPLGAEPSAGLSVA
jgi:hypothetical protein